MLRHELTQLIDDRNGVEITLSLSFAPGKQTVPAEHNSITTGVFFHRFPQHHRQLKARALPREPD
jgi:hypothetical protein